MKAETKRNIVIGVAVAALLAIALSYVGVKALTPKPRTNVAQLSPAAAQQIAKATETAPPTLMNPATEPNAKQNVAPPNQSPEAEAITSRHPTTEPSAAQNVAPPNQQPTGNAGAAQKQDAAEQSTLRTQPGRPQIAAKNEPENPSNASGRTRSGGSNPRSAGSGQTAAKSSGGGHSTALSWPASNAPPPASARPARRAFGAEPRILGWEPTFQMGGSPTPAAQTPTVSAPTSTKSSASRRLQYEICPYCGAIQLPTYDSRHYSLHTCSKCGHVLIEGAAPSESPSSPPTVSASGFLPESSQERGISPGSTSEPSVLPPAAASQQTASTNLGSGAPAPSGRSASPSAAPSGSAGVTNALEEVDATLKKLDLGDIAFKVPERLPLRQHATVILLLSPTGPTSPMQNAAQLTAILRQETSAGEKVESAERIQISGLMEAKLAGPAFEIRAITPEEPQLVSGKEPTEWKWDVTPKQPGQQSLHLTINAIVKFDGANHPRTIRSFDRTIQVEVPAGFSLVSGLAKQKWMIIALIALAIIALGFLSWRLSSRGRSKPPSTTVPAPAGDQDLFVSYSRRDQKQVLALTKLLERRGFKIWIDQHRLDGASLWPKEVTEALLRAKVFVLVISKASVVSQNVIRELSLASEESKTILPLQLEQVEIPSSIRYQLAGIQSLVLNPRNPQENADHVIRTLSKLGVMQSQ